MSIVLRPITLEDGKNIVRWRNSEEVKSHCLTKTVITEESNAEFFRNNVETGKYKQFIVEYSDKDFPIVTYPIASVYLKDMDYGNNRCELSGLYWHGTLSFKAQTVFDNCTVVRSWTACILQIYRLSD